MEISDNKVDFSEGDFREVFALFTSSTAHELRQIDDPTSEHYFERENIREECEICSDKREFAIDALRAVIAFLHRHGYRIEKDGKVLSLAGISEHFIE